MSRGHGRIQRIILESVNGTRYGCTIRQLAYRAYGVARLEVPTEAQLVAVRRAVRRLVDEGRVLERVMFGTDRYIVAATPPVPRPRTRVNLAVRQVLQCRACDLRWVSERSAPHRLCWSCGEPGTPARRAPSRRG